MDLLPEDPLFTIGVAARMLGLHVQTLRQYERIGLVKPSRTPKQTRLYSQQDLMRLECITYMVKMRGLNLAGVKMVVEMSSSLPEVDHFIRIQTGLPVVLQVQPVESPNPDERLHQGGLHDVELD